jgi:hypothetical protein
VPSSALGPRGAPFAREGLRGRVFGPLDERLAAALAGWLEREIPGAERLSASAFRCEAWTVKRFPAPSVFGWLRPPRALRSAWRHFDCLPVPSPRPLVALARNRRGPSLLVREFVSGRTLTEVWGRDEAAERALPDFLAALRRLPLQHGDLHPGNLLWTGTGWVLLDVDGLRHGLHRRARVLAGQWLCLLGRLGTDGRAERLFRRTQALAPGLDPTSWEDVVRTLAQRRSPTDPRGG